MEDRYFEAFIDRLDACSSRVHLVLGDLIVVVEVLLVNKMFRNIL